MSERVVAWFRGRPHRIVCVPFTASLVLALVFARTRFAPATLAFLCGRQETSYGMTLALISSVVALLPPELFRRAFLSEAFRRTFRWAKREFTSPPPESARSASFARLASHFLALLVVSWTAFSVNRASLLAGYDGDFARVTIDRDYEWSTPGPYTDMNPLAALGNVGCTAHTLCSPGLTLGVIAGGGEVNAVVAYTATAVETFAAMLVLGWCLRLGATVTLASAWGLTLSAMPFRAAPAMYDVAAPSFVEFIAAQAVMVGVVYRMGEHGWGRTWIACLVILAASNLWSFANGVFYPIVTVPSFAFFATVFVLGSSSRRELATRLVGLGILVVLAAPTVIPNFLGSVLDTVPAFFSPELENTRRELKWVSGIFRDTSLGWLSRPLVVLGLAGALVALVTGERGVRRVAIATLAEFGAILGIGLYTTWVARDYRGPSTLYYEFFLWPFYWVFSIYLAAVAGRRAISGLRRVAARSSRVDTATVVSCVGTLLVGAWIGISWRSSMPYSRSGLNQPWRNEETPIVHRLDEAIALHPGDSFRGSVATFMGYQGREGGTRWFDINMTDFSLQIRTGNDHRAMGLWWFGIPTLNEYNQAMTPGFYAMASRILARPQDQQIRTFIVLTRPDVAYLRSLGVRFMITDFVFTDPDARPAETLVVTEPGREPWALRLYELARPNLATYSPTKTSVAADAAALLARVQSPGFDFAEEAVSFDPLPPGLERAVASRLRFEKDRCVIEAASHGRSLILLPLQFSHCLELAVKSSSGSTEAPRLVRLNLMQAGLLFSGTTEVEVRLRSGPFHNPYGRLEDYWDMKNVRLQELPRTAGGQ